jgi:hypothetical protein
VTNLSTYLGLDVHKETIAVAIADGRSSDVRFYGGITGRGDYAVRPKAGSHA